jgi:hypothetical protein
MAFGLSGCVAAAIPLLLVAEGAAVGLTTYKTVQVVSGGGTFKVGFPGKDGKDAPLMPLPPVKSVAVWPGDQGDVMFAQKLSETRRFQVSSPASVSGVLTNKKITADRKLLTEQEQAAAFAVVCDETHAELIFASRNLGTTSNENFLSLSRANVTYQGELLGFSCAQKSGVWREQVALIVEVGGKSPPTAEELNQAAAQALVDRVIQAEDLGVRQASAS